MAGLVGETFVQAELEFHRERAMQQFNRRPHRKHGRHVAWPFARHTPATRQAQRPAVS